MIGVTQASTAISVSLLSLLAILTSPQVFAQSTSSPPVTVNTADNSVSVVLNWTPAEVPAGEDVEFSLEFRNPDSGQTLSHVNYELKIIDPSNGEATKSIADIHTHAGQDAQTVKFDNTGDFILEVTVIGLGINQPYDTSRSGTVQTAIMVVPEFPLALLAMAAAVAIVIILPRFRYASLTKFLTRK